jgi:hypothetical protein
VGPGLGPEGVVQRDGDHGVGVEALLADHPLGAVPAPGQSHRMEKNMIIQTQYKYFSESHAPTSIFSQFGAREGLRLRLLQQRTHG